MPQFLFLLSVWQWVGVVLLLLVLLVWFDKHGNIGVFFLLLFLAFAGALLKWG
jgi:hypothetical protein